MPLAAAGSLDGGKHGEFERRDQQSICTDFSKSTTANLPGFAQEVGLGQPYVTGRSWSAITEGFVRGDGWKAVVSGAVLKSR